VLFIIFKELKEMNVEMRKTAQGTEYWDTKEKRIRFVPAGKEPGFVVTKEPKSMVGGIDLATGKDMTTVNGKPVDNETEINLDSMNADQLRDFAKQNDIEVPGNMKKEETIRAHILESFTADDE
jgi:hypothetical protein